MNGVIDLPGGGFRGFFKMEAFKGVFDKNGKLIGEVPGSRHVLADWFPNLITNQGLNYVGQYSTYLSACQVGTSSTAPANSDTGLVGFLVGTTTVQSTTYGAAASSPYYGKITLVFRFATGVAAGNLSEVGVGRAATGSVLFSRALIVDGVGTPTTITVLSDEILDVTYELRLYVPLVDVTGSTTLNGISRSYTIRGFAATSELQWARGLGVTATGNWNAGGIGGSHVNYTGALVAITGTSITGGIAVPSSIIDSAYAVDSYFKQAAYSWAPGQGTNSAIKTHTFFSSIGAYQMEFSPVLNKTAAMVLTHNFRHHWARHV